VIPVKKETLDNIATEIIVCTDCRLSRTRRKAVPGEGNPHSKIMFIGEGPGRSEDIEGRPFTGQAGKLLHRLLSEVHLSKNNSFICNIVKCRPPKNRPPLPDEIQACTPYLDRQIRVVEPRLTVTLGKCATAHVFSKAALPFSSITQVHGKFYDAVLLGRRTTIFPAFHPASALYSAKYKKKLTVDFRLLGHQLGKMGIAH